MQGQVTPLLSGLLVVVFLWDAPTHWAIHPATFEASTLVTSMLLHAHLRHLAYNVIGLVIGGIVFERQHGPWTLLLFTLVAGSLGGLAEVLAEPHFSGNILGASGAVCALFGAFATRDRTAALGTLVLFAALSWELLTAETGAAHWAHIAGFFCGWAWAIGVSLLDALREKRR